MGQRGIGTEGPGQTAHGTEGDWDGGLGQKEVAGTKTLSQHNV